MISWIVLVKTETKNDVSTKNYLIFFELICFLLLNSTP